MLKFTILLISLVGSVVTRSAEQVRQRIDLLATIRADDVDYHINDSAEIKAPAREIFQFRDGQLHISGQGYGYVATRKDFANYHLVIEFRWGRTTWGERTKRARDNGLLIHAHGPHGAYAGSWMASVEAQIIEGGTGDILVLSPTLKDGSALTTSVTVESTLDPNGQKLWKPGAPRQAVTKGRVNWEKRDPAWTDTIGFRGQHDLDAPVGEWNRFEVVARGDTLRYFFNGTLVNEAFAVTPAAGRICLQTEAAEMIVRRYELWPLGEFTEPWAINSNRPAKASTQ